MSAANGESWLKYLKISRKAMWRNMALGW